MDKFRHYFWPKTALIFYIFDERIYSAFGYIEDKEWKRQEEREFELVKSFELVEWFNEICQTYPKTFLCAMLDTVNQGALPSCLKSKLEEHEIDSSLVHTVCIDSSWQLFTSLVEMKWFEKKFEGVEFDLLYSPFVLLYSKASPSLEKKPELFMLHTKNVAFLAIFSKNTLWYAHVITIEVNDEEDIKKDGGDEPDELAFDLDMIDSEVESISDVDLLGEFKDSLEKNNRDDNGAFELLEYNLNLFEELKGALLNFYRDDRYKHDFIESVVIYDMDDLGDDLTKYIEEELFMKAKIEKFDPIDTMAKLAIKDIEVKV